MFSNAKKFFKKNILLIGIVVLLIIIAVYFLYINVKEGFDGPAPEKAQLIPVSIIEQVYNQWPDPNTKSIVATLVELYKLFLANYNDAFEVSLQIIASQKAIEDFKRAENGPPPRPTYSDADQELVNQEMRKLMQLTTRPLTEQQREQMNRGGRLVETQEIKDQRAVVDRTQQLARDRAMQSQQAQQQLQLDLVKQLPQKINPGIQKVLINAIKWLPTAKRFYDNFVSNNYYGLITPGGGFDNDAQQNKAQQKMQQFILTLSTMLMNALWNEDKLSIVLGPTFAKSNPTPPLPMPVNNEQYLTFIMNTPPEISQPVFSKGIEYIVNLGKPFIIIQEYLTQSVVKDLQTNNAQGFIQNNAIPNTIIQLIEQLNTALANDATDQASIGQLTGQIGELTSKLNAASANDMTDQNTITRLQGQVYDLQSRQPPMTTQPLPAPPCPIPPLAVQRREIPPKIGQRKEIPPRFAPPRDINP